MKEIKTCLSKWLLPQHEFKWHLLLSKCNGHLGYWNQSTVCWSEKVKVCRVEKADHTVPKLNQLIGPFLTHNISTPHNITARPCLQHKRKKGRTDGYLSTMNTRLGFCDRHYVKQSKKHFSVTCTTTNKVKKVLYSSQEPREISEAAN